MMRLNNFFVLFVILLGGNVFAQPNTSNLYLFEYKSEESGKYQFSNPAFLTVDNRASYNNQPYFVGEDLYFSAIYSESQTDIYKCDISEKTRKNLTLSPESEYSVRLTPDGEHLSVVRVSADATAKQQLWQFDLNGKYPELLTPELSNIGYYDWVDKDNLVLFILGEPHKMVLYNLKDRSTQLIKRDIGRCIKVVDKKAYFVDSRAEDSKYIKEVNLETFVIRNIIGTVEDSEDFVIAPNGDFLMGKDSNLYKYNPSQDKDWKLIANFSDLGISNIKRLSVNGNKIVLVDAKEMHTASN